MKHHSVLNPSHDRCEWFASTTWRAHLSSATKKTLSLVNVSSTMVCDLLPVAVSGVAEILSGVAEIEVISLEFDK